MGKYCVVGDYTNLSIGSKIRDGVVIGSNVVVGMGSVVINNIPDNVIVVGAPAKILRQNPVIYG